MTNQQILKKLEKRYDKFFGFEDSYHKLVAIGIELDDKEYAEYLKVFKKLGGKGQPSWRGIPINKS